MDTKYIVSKMAPYYKAHGFKRKSSLFYKIEDNIAYCIRFQRPGLFYVHFYIIPLYMKFDGHFLMYGNRLNDLKDPDDPRKWMLEALYFAQTTETECNEWIERLKKVSENFVLPYFDEIGSDKKLMDTLNKGEYLYNCWGHFCNRFDLYRLRAYTNFILSNYKEALEDIKIAHDMIDKLEYIALELRNGWHDEMNVLEEMTRATEEERQLFINNNIEYTIEHCFKPKKRK